MRNGKRLKVIRLFALLAFLANVPGARGADEKTVPGQWTVGASSAEVNKTITVWLAVQPLPSAESIAVTVETPSEATISPVPAEPAKCEVKGDQKVVCTAPVRSPLLIEFTVTPRAAGTMRLLGLLEYSGKNLPQSGYVISSDPITVKDRYELNPTATAVVSALFGLLAGLVTQLFASSRQAKQDREKRKLDEDAALRQAQRQIETKLLTVLGPEINQNKTAIEVYLKDRGHAPVLAVGAYNTLLADGAIFGYLNAPARQDYLKNINSLYQLIQNYHEKVHGNAPADQIHEKAVELLAGFNAFPGVN